MADETKTTTKQPKWTAIHFRSADGARLAVYARVMKTGGFRAGVEHSTPLNGDGKRIHTRGATSQHATLAEALAQRDTLAAQAAKQGWQRPRGPVGQPKPDAFDAAHIPAPVAKPAAKK